MFIQGREHNLNYCFFHGRGGTVSRGAGPTRRFLEALPRGSLEGGLRLTEQGEVIAQKYNNPENAISNLEYRVAGAAVTPLVAKREDRDTSWKPLFERLASSSRSRCRELLELPGLFIFSGGLNPSRPLSAAGSGPGRHVGQGRRPSTT